MPKSVATKLFLKSFVFSFVFVIILTFPFLILSYNSSEYSLNSISKTNNLISATPTIIPTNSPSPTPIKPQTTIAPTNAPISTNNNPPGAGYQRQVVNTDAGNFSIDIIAADLNSTRVIVDTASSSDCPDNCPVMPLSDYVARSGAYAGINGTYFCPTSYSSCAGKTNSFDLLVMNKDKYYFNSANNVYSTNPAVIFSGNSARFVGQALEWGRDTGVDSVISNFPLLVFGGNVSYGGGGDAKFEQSGPRGFVANKGSIVYIGVIRNATMAQAAKVLKSIGMDNAMNLDEGGSTALMYNGSYLAGPGRNIPNALLFVRK